MSPKPGALAVLLLAASVCAQTGSGPIEPNGPAQQPNTQKTYAALRADLPGSDGVSVKDFTLEREGGVFHFDQGDFYFYAPVEGHITGAVFTGNGHFELAVKDAGEQRSLALLTKSGEMQQDFSTLVLRFTDGTADEIRKASSTASPTPDDHIRGAAEDLAKNYRKDLSDNLELRLLADLLSPSGAGQFFFASFRMGNILTGKNLVFIVDPEGTPHASPDQVELTSWSDVELQPWVAYKMLHSDPQISGSRVRVTDEKLDVTIDRGATMKTSAETTMKVLHDGVRVVHLNLYPSLRVAGVYSESGAPLDFVQEDKKLDPDFAAILPAPAKAGDTLRLLTVYAGKDALRADGNETYYLLESARESWYPAGTGGLGDFVNFHMTFHIPKNLQIVATGKQLSLTPESGGMMKAVWETDSPIPVAGFNLGDFKTKDSKTPQGFDVTAYADIGLPDQYDSLSRASADGEMALGNLSAVTALPNEVSQGVAAIQIYSDFFGKLPYDHVALTEQTACGFGQSWPMLVYLPICGFWDDTVKHQLGLLDYDASYWREVTPHEVSHQWWGQLVGFNSYRDQWMSEGFANFSVGVFLMNTQPNMVEYRNFWKEQQKDLLQKNREGVRPIDAGTLTMGGRVSNEKTGNVYQALIYSKGAYVLHMLEMAYWTPQDNENIFKRSMQQFVSDYSGKAATTEDWKASMEKTMPKWMDLRGDGKLDWFFDEWVYGTELPHYDVTSEFSTTPDGITSVHMKLTQSNVSKTFVMRIPLYLEMQNGSTVRMANVVIHGSDSIDHTFTLGKLPSPGKALLVNYNADILSDN
jgi:hypothetical protein